MKKIITATLLSVLISPSIIFGSHHGKEDFISEPVKRSLQEQLAHLNPNVKIACKKSKQEDAASESDKRYCPVFYLYKDKLYYTKDDLDGKIETLRRIFTVAFKSRKINKEKIINYLVLEKHNFQYRTEREISTKHDPAFTSELANLMIPIDEYCSSPVLWIAFKRQVDISIFEALINAGANINNLFNDAPQQTMLCAIFQDHYKSHSDISKRADLFNYSLECVKLIIAAGADLSIKDYSGFTAFEILLNYQKTGEADFLFEAFQKKAVNMMLTASNYTLMHTQQMHERQHNTKKISSEKINKFAQILEPILKLKTQLASQETSNGHSPLDYFNGYDKIYCQLFFHNPQLPEENQIPSEDLNKLSFTVLKKLNKVRKEVQNKTTPLKDISNELRIIQQQKESLQSLWDAENLVLMQRQSDLKTYFNIDNQDQEK